MSNGDVTIEKGTGVLHSFNCTPAFVGYASCWRTCLRGFHGPIIILRHLRRKKKCKLLYFPSFLTCSWLTWLLLLMSVSWLWSWNCSLSLSFCHCRQTVKTV